MGTKDQFMSDYRIIMKAYREAIVDVIYEARREGAVTRLEDILKKKQLTLIASYNGTAAGGESGC